MTSFDRDAMARWYAERHLEVDPGVIRIVYCPKGAPEREIRLVEVNDLIAETMDDSPKPLDFGVDRRSDGGHNLVVLDLTPSQWDSLAAKKSVRLPEGWTLDGAKELGLVRR